MKGIYQFIEIVAQLLQHRLSALIGLPQIASLLWASHAVALKKHWIFLLWIYKESVACHFYIISVNFLYASYIWSSPHSQKVRPFLPPTPPPPFPLFHPGQILPKIKLDLKSNYIKPEQNRIKSNPIQSEQINFKIILVHCCCCCCCLYKCSYCLYGWK